MMSFRARLISILVGLLVFGIISFLVRRRRLYNIYAVSWFVIAIVFLIMGIFPNSVEAFASLLGIYFTPAAILVVAIGGLMAIVLHLSIIVTEQHKQIRHFEKEIALQKRLSPGTEKTENSTGA